MDKVWISSTIMMMVDNIHTWLTIWKVLVVNITLVLIKLPDWSDLCLFQPWNFPNQNALDSQKSNVNEEKKPCLASPLDYLLFSQLASLLHSQLVSFGMPRDIKIDTFKILSKLYWFPAFPLLFWDHRPLIWRIIVGLSGESLSACLANC